MRAERGPVQPSACAYFGLMLPNFTHCCLCFHFPLRRAESIIFTGLSCHRSCSSPQRAQTPKHGLLKPPRDSQGFLCQNPTHGAGLTPAGSSQQPDGKFTAQLRQAWGCQEAPWSGKGPPRPSHQLLSIQGKDKSK